MIEWYRSLSPDAKFFFNYYGILSQLYEQFSSLWEVFSEIT